MLTRAGKLVVASAGFIILGASSAFIAQDEVTLRNELHNRPIAVEKIVVTATPTATPSAMITPTRPISIKSNVPGAKVVTVTPVK